MNRHFNHSGDLGDIIFSLPTIRALGGGVLHLYNAPGVTRAPMTPDRFSAIAPLLKIQPYIQSVVYEAQRPTFGEFLDIFRRHLNATRTLADATLACFSLPASQRSAAWLEVFPVPYAPVVISRTARYHNDDALWHQVREKYHAHSVFLGFPDEHAAFVRDFGDVRHQPTDNLLDAAQIIAGSDLFISNQGALHAVAEGLKHNLILEVHRRMTNCTFLRSGCVLVHGRVPVELPDLTL